ncbi:uncharacterized protein Dana_GF18017 [Drosophila ananassae]|uniref:ODAD1 central coiled coil region domain-containing protein n=1 Tax=Drosophila ananassae TaxID=7217 RepID=B3LV24_DROAN|nr:outer dynein arm-docking complex subunit 1 [Drosophila ananassae]EDV42496.1 uncharacterized protein Dana_GF18017 [Drosophila ananassae]
MDDTEKFDKTHFFESFLAKHKDLGRRQREYKKILGTKLVTRSQLITETSYQTSNNQLMEEKDELRAQIWVASSASYRKEDQRHLDNIRCHVECQENLATDINALKNSIINMEREIGRLSKQIYHLNQNTVPDERYTVHVGEVRKKLSILEDALETGVRHECAMASANANLRQQLIWILNQRTFFNDSYTKMVQKLNSDKKYMKDMVDYAVTTFDNCIDVYEKLDKLAKHTKKEKDQRRLEAQGLMRKLSADEDINTFFNCKAKPRELADLQPKEYERRDKFRTMHRKKINLYTSVLKKLLHFTNSLKMDEVIAKFQNQESLYYSFFNYSTEMSYHITMLNNSVNRLMADIEALRQDNKDTLQDQLEKIESLEAQVAAKEESNSVLSSLREKNDTQLENLLHGIEAVCQICAIDVTPFNDLLGDHTHVNLVNLQRFLKALETRIQHVVASVYVEDRRTGDPIRFVVREVSKPCEELTRLSDIVMTQQCPECAETEAYNIDEGGELSYPHTIKEAKRKLYEKVTQPEIQYRLHSISQCRLPRSRLLAAKRSI